jgi:PAS domain S-box-containing protein
MVFPRRPPACEASVQALAESESLFRAVYQNAPVGICITSPEGRLLRMNPRYCEMFGYTAEELSQLTFHDLTHPADLETDISQTRALLSNQINEFTLEKRYRHRDGREIWGRLTVSAVRSPWGDIRFLVAVVEDITRRKRAEDALRRSEEARRHFMESADDMMYFQGADGALDLMNTANERITGYTLEDFRRNPQLLRTIVEPEDVAHAERFLESHPEGVPFFEVEYRIRTRHRGVRWIHSRMKGVWDDGGRFLGYNVVDRDITELKNAERALKERLRYEEGLARCSRALLEDAGNPSLAAGLDHLRTASRAWRVVLLENPPPPGDESAEESAPIERASAGDSWPHGRSLPFPRPDEAGWTRWRDLLGRGDAVAGAADDFPEAEREWLLREKFTRLLLLPVGVRGAWWGALAFVDREPGPAWRAEDIALLRTAAGMVGIHLEREVNADERRAMEKGLRQAQKMQAIGTFAGGIAHDFNNILAPIIGYTEMAMDMLPPDHPGRENLRRVLTAGDRARDLVGQILALSRRRPGQRTVIQLQPVIKEALQLLRATLPAFIEVESRIDSECGPVRADPTRIHQVMMNLATNAYHAMRDGGGRLGVTLDELPPEADSPATAATPLSDAPRVRLTVGDTGPGMAPTVLENIFTPYYTTKPEGEGTGLGLATVHGIVADHGGHIGVESRIGQGTVFRIDFPRAESENRDAAKPAAAPQPGAGRLLVVDDEIMIVQMTAIMLQRLGYRVTPHTDPLEALEDFRRRPDDFDLVLTDLTMPRMTGDALIRELLRLRPNLPVILYTGFSERMDEDDAMALGAGGFLLKPMGMSTLSAAVGQALRVEQNQEVFANG